MPQGMHLRSSCDWSLDPMGVHSIDAYLKKLGRACRDVEPLSRDFYVDYADWFRHEKGIQSLDVTVRSLHTEGRDLVALTEGGKRIRSRFVALAIGYGNFCPCATGNSSPCSRETTTIIPPTWSTSDDSRIGVFSSLVGGRALSVDSADRERPASVLSISTIGTTPLRAQRASAR